MYLQKCLTANRCNPAVTKSVANLREKPSSPDKRREGIMANGPLILGAVYHTAVHGCVVLQIYFLLGLARCIGEMYSVRAGDPWSQNK